MYYFKPRAMQRKPTEWTIYRRISGEVVARIDVSPRMRRGCVWMPLHFPESITNRLTNDAGDSVTGTGEYKVCAVTIQPLEPLAAR